MTNEQLYLYLTNLVDVFQVALTECYSLMPENAPREIKKSYRLKPEYRQSGILFVSENMKEYYDIKGDFEALKPFQYALNNLESQIEILRPPIQEINR